MTQMKPSEFDPVTFNIIQNAIEAVADEMFVAQRKTSMSAIIYEVLDLSSGVLDKHGQVAASGAGIPAFIGVLDKAIAGILKSSSWRKSSPVMSSLQMTLIMAVSRI